MDIIPLARHRLGIRQKYGWENHPAASRPQREYPRLTALGQETLAFSVGVDSWPIMVRALSKGGSTAHLAQLVLLRGHN